MLPLTIRNRIITDEDVSFIQDIVHEHWQSSRTDLSKIICRRWNWRQPNGRLKDMACREILLNLERHGHLSLPPARHNGRNEKRNRVFAPALLDQTPLKGNITNYGPATIAMIRNTPLEPLYSSLLHQYHYLGYRQIVGPHLKYMAFLENRPIACLGWGAAAWAVKARDAFIGWDKPAKEKNLSAVVNNTRFLILPWVSIKCLASKLLALNVRRIAQDWMKVYQQPVYLLETFVEKDRFRGTCYRAAGWQRIGSTQGRTRNDRNHCLSAPVKDVYLYPLSPDFRRELCA